jgi:hypothetical protein
MSDLAPFVATILRDQVVSDLQEENRILKERLRATQKVQIVSGTGHDEGYGNNNNEDDGDGNKDEIIRFAESQLENGNFKNSGHLFMIPLNVQHQPCPIEKLKNVRICLGGFHNGYINKDFGAFFGNNEDSTDTSIVIHSCGGQNERRLWVSFTVNNWPRENYLELVNAESEGQLNEIQMMEFIVERLPELYPDATITFHDITLWSHGNQDAIQNLPSSLLARLTVGMDAYNSI